jgi:hypothetical protein
MVVSNKRLVGYISPTNLINLHRLPYHLNIRRYHLPWYKRQYTLRLANILTITVANEDFNRTRASG